MKISVNYLTQEGENVPDINNYAALAELFEVSLDRDGLNGTIRYRVEVPAPNRYGILTYWRYIRAASSCMQLFLYAFRTLIEVPSTFDW